MEDNYPPTPPPSEASSEASTIRLEPMDVEETMMEERFLYHDIDASLEADFTGMILQEDFENLVHDTYGMLIKNYDVKENQSPEIQDCLESDMIRLRCMEQDEHVRQSPFESHPGLHGFSRRAFMEYICLLLFAFPEIFEYVGHSVDLKGIFNMVEFVFPLRHFCQTYKMEQQKKMLMVSQMYPYRPFENSTVFLSALERNHYLTVLSYLEHNDNPTFLSLTHYSVMIYWLQQYEGPWCVPCNCGCGHMVNLLALRDFFGHCPLCLDESGTGGYFVRVNLHSTSSTFTNLGHFVKRLFALPWNKLKKVQMELPFRRVETIAEYRELEMGAYYSPCCKERIEEKLMVDVTLPGRDFVWYSEKPHIKNTDVVKSVILQLEHVRNMEPLNAFEIHTAIRHASMVDYFIEMLWMLFKTSFMETQLPLNSLRSNYFDE